MRCCTRAGPGPGLLIRWWSFLALGPYFTLVLKTSADQTVVDRGPARDYLCDNAA